MSVTVSPETYIVLMHTGSAIDVSGLPDVSMGGLMHQYGGNNTITGSAIDASVRLDVSTCGLD